jgi:hypothetical protein
LVDERPNFKPLRVTMTFAKAAIPAVAVVTTIAVDDGGAEVPLTDPLINTLGVAELLKKPEGYVNVMKLPMASAPPAVVVKLKVAATFAFSATRSESSITNDAPLYKSTALEKYPPPAVTPIRRQPPAPHTQQSNKPPQTRKRHTIARTHQPKQQTLNKQRQTAITCLVKAPREDGHVPNRCRSKKIARHTEPSSRP